jgi:hypothetical protein
MLVAVTGGGSRSVSESLRSPAAGPRAGLLAVVPPGRARSAAGAQPRRSANYVARIALAPRSPAALRDPRRTPVQREEGVACSVARLPSASDPERLGSGPAPC